LNSDPSKHDAPRPPASQPAARSRAASESARRFDVLLSLLQDDSPVVLAEVRSQFLSAGRAGEQALRRAVRSGSAHQRGRARQLLLVLDRRRVVRRLIRRVSAGVDLERGLFLLDNYWSPGLDVRPYRKALDAMANMVQREAARRSPGIERAHALVHVLSKEMGFCGATDDFHHPDNIFLGRSIERRRGMPLTLCAIFAFVARRAQIKTSLLPFPGHILLRLHHGPRPSDTSIVDPFGGGQILAEKQCLAYIDQHGLTFRPEWLRPASAADLFERHVRNLRQSCRARGRFAEARELELVLRATADSDQTGAALR
jgi:regulator of sirC expression with transglutaminase-like and TPR domain